MGLSLSTIRRRAAKIGYHVEKGFVRFQGDVYYNSDGTRESGYVVRDLQTGYIVGGSDNYCYSWSYIWNLEDVADFLRGAYDVNGMAW